MKKLLLALPLLVSGCFHATFNDPTPVPAPPPHVVSIAGGTTGAVSYSCEQYEAKTDGITFHCTFHNDTDQVQPGPAVKLGIYSEASTLLLKESETIYSYYMAPGESSEKYLFWHRVDLPNQCGYNLERCNVLVDKVWPK
jgi:hypothetical protein